MYSCLDINTSVTVDRLQWSHTSSNPIHWRASNPPTRADHEWHWASCNFFFSFLILSDHVLIFFSVCHCCIPLPFYSARYVNFWDEILLVYIEPFIRRAHYCASYVRQFKHRSSQHSLTLCSWLMKGYVHQSKTKDGALLTDSQDTFRSNSWSVWLYVNFPWSLTSWSAHMLSSNLCRRATSGNLVYWVCFEN